MFRFFATIVLLTVFAQGARSQEAVTNALVPGAKPTDHGSYTVGFDIGRDLAAAGFLPTDCSPRDFIQGVMDAISKQNSKLSDAEIEAALLKIRTNLDTRRAETKKKNLETANAFFEANKKKLGVVALPSGLQYLIVKTGNGAQATLKNRV